MVNQLYSTIVVTQPLITELTNNTEDEGYQYSLNHGEEDDVESDTDKLKTSVLLTSKHDET